MGILCDAGVACSNKRTAPVKTSLGMSIGRSTLRAVTRERISGDESVPLSVRRDRLLDGICEAGRRFRVAVQEQGRLDQLQFHEQKLTVLDNAVDASVDRRFEQAQNSVCALNCARGRFGDARASAKIILYPEVSEPRRLQDSVAEY